VPAVVTMAAGVSISDLAWIGWALALLSLVTGFVYFRANRKVKRIDWRIDSDQDLINFPATDLAEEITVLVDGNELRHPRAVQLTIKNTGNVGLRTETMYREFEVSCRGKQKLITATVTRTSAKQKRSEGIPVMISPNDALVGPLSTLLNPGNHITCQLLLDGPGGLIEVLGEAEDFEIRSRWGAELDKIEPIGPNPKWVALAGAGGVIVVVIMTVVQLAIS
jgi:hypothetical protein